MSTNTKKIGFLSGILSAVKSLGNPETIEEDNNLENCKDIVDAKTLEVLKATGKNTDKKGEQVNSAIVVEGAGNKTYNIDNLRQRLSGNGGNQINAPINSSRYEKASNNSKGKEIVD